VPIPFRFHLLKLLARIPFLVRSMQSKALADLELTAARSVTNSELRQRLLSNEKSRALFVALTASTFDRMASRMTGTDNDIRVTQTTEYALERIKVPTLIVHGDSDPIVPFAAHAQVAAARIPCADLLVLEGGEHAAIFTHMAEVQDRMARFLAPGRSPL